MTIEQLENQLKQSLAEKIAKAEEAKKRTPEPLRIGRDGNLITAAENMAVATFKKLRGNRTYALDSDARLELAAIAIAGMRQKRNLFDTLNAFADGIEQLADTLEPAAAKQIGRWRQIQPAEDAGKVPPLPTDPCTKLPVRNPWMPLAPLKKGETTPHFDHGSQAVIREKWPKLATWLERCAANDGQPSAKMLDELEGEHLIAEAQRRIEYGDAQWQQNLLRPDSGANLTEKNLFVRSIEDPYQVERHRLEAEMGSPRGYLGNLTFRMLLAKRDPALSAIHKEAASLLAEWKADASREKAA